MMTSTYTWNDYALIQILQFIHPGCWVDLMTALFSWSSAKTALMTRFLECFALFEAPFRRVLGKLTLL